MGRGQQTVVIVGGGASGALTAYHLVKRSAAVRLAVIEPRAQLGLGLAYSTTSRQHLLNVPAGKVSALPEQPDHFLEWVQANYDAHTTAADFLSRAIFGKYVQSLVANCPEIEHFQTSAIDCVVEREKPKLLLSDGRELFADAVVLATGNFDPPPFGDATSAWDEANYANLSAEAPVILIGSGLTAVDALLKLRETGHRGMVTAISGHGMLPHRHAPYTPLQHCAIDGEAPATARLLLRQVRRAVKSASCWRAVIDSLRERVNELWLALPAVEQERFRRHLLRRWEVVRHRMAPRIADCIDRELAAGTLAIQQGRVEEVVSGAGGVTVHVQSKNGARKELTAARVINCTGPEMNYRRVSSPLIHSLFRQGLAVSGPLGTGLWSDEHGALRAADGTFSNILFTIGPGRLGTLLESIAVPELRQQAAELAATLVTCLREKVQPSLSKPLLNGGLAPATPDALQSV